MFFLRNCCFLLLGAEEQTKSAHLSGQQLNQECELCEPLFYNKAEEFHGADFVDVWVAQRALFFFGFGPGCSHHLLLAH